MDPLALLAGVWNVLTYLPPFLVVLAVVVFVHEFGHYIVARWCGIQAEVFSIGFGKVLWSRVDKRGTRWQVALLPLGGYVKFVGDMDPASAGAVEDDKLSEEERRVAFHTAPVGRRAATVVAGPVANFLLSILVFAGLALVAGKASDAPVIGTISEDAPADLGLAAGDRVISVDGTRVETFRELLDILHMTDGRSVPARVERDGARQDITVHYSIPPRIVIRPGMPASRAGLFNDDVIVSLNGQSVHSFYALQLIAADLPPEAPIEVGIDRGGERLIYEVEPVMTERPHPITGEVVPQPTLGVGPVTGGGFGPTTVDRSVLDALQYGVERTWDIIVSTLAFFGDMLFANADPSNIGGPIQIAELSGQQAEQGVLSFIQFIAFLSTAIGLLNLFPIPVLDGGHLMFYGIEAVRGRPVGGAAMQVGTMIGLTLVLSLMVFATYNDITRVLAG